MISVDTSVLLRAVVGDDPLQQGLAARRLADLERTGETVLVPTVVLAELAWTLRVTFRLSRSAIADAIERIGNTPPFVVQSRAVVDDALAGYRTGPADFADYLILATSLAEGARGLLTFDGNLLKSPRCEAP